MTERKLCLAILGPTASGKSTFAMEIASQIPSEIVCVDSTTVYRGMDIGSAKPNAEDRAKVPHHLLDVLEPSEPFSAGHFVQHADEVIEDIQSRGKLPIVVGGTYFYLRALQHGMYPLPIIPADVIEGIEKEFFEDDRVNTEKMHAALKAADSKSAEAIHPNDRYRVVRALAIVRTTGEKPSELKPQPLSSAQKDRLWLKYAMCLSRHQLDGAIVRRTEKMIAAGLVQETKALMEKYPGARALGSIGYKETCDFLNRKITEKQLRNEIIEKTRQLAKRQITWLRSDPEVRYVDFKDGSRVKLEVENLRFALGRDNVA